MLINMEEKIRTIFYFAEDLPYTAESSGNEEVESYLRMLQLGKISHRTIVFAHK